MKKTVGILGGMGPQATADLFSKITASTKTRIEQDHLKVIIISNPHIPDRTDYILHGRNSPLPCLIETARELEHAGADFIVMPCNTAHVFIEELQKAVSIPILDMIEIVTAFVADRAGKGRPVGLLATAGTLQSGVYRKAFQAKGMDMLVPAEAEQQIISRIIYQIKQGTMDPCGKESLLSICRSLYDRGASCILLGCTELPLVLQNLDSDSTLYDATRILAEKTVAYACDNPCGCAE